MTATVARPGDFTKSNWTVFTDSTTVKSSAVKDWFKALGYVGKWWELCDPNLSSNSKAFFALGGDGKNFISALELFKNTGEIVTAFSKDKPLYDKIDAVSRTSNNAGDLMKLLSRFFTIPHMKHIEGVSSAFTFVGAVNNVFHHGSALRDLDKLPEPVRWNNGVHQVINLISDLAYMTFGFLAVAMWLGLLVVPTIAVLLPLTVALICSFTNYYFKNLVNLNGESPDNKKAIAATKYVQTL